MKNTVMLPAGCEEVPVSDIPWRIAEAIINTEWIANDYIVEIRKKENSFDMSPEEHGQTVPEEKLTDDDWKELNEVCKTSGLPPVKVGMPVTKYRLCERAFEKCNADWVLIPYTKNTRDYHSLKSVEASHREALKEAAEKGEVVMLDKLTRLPLSQPISSEKIRFAIVTIEELTRYLVKSNLKVFVSNKDEGQLKEPANKSPAKKERQDALAVELYEILSTMTKHTSALVMAELKKRIGKEYSCICANVGDGIKWEDNKGNTHTLNISALTARISYWKKKKNKG